MAELTGQGTLYDAEQNEIASVAYRIEREPIPDSPIWDWGGALLFNDDDVLPEVGTYVLEIEDGTRGEIELKPVGATAGGAREVAFAGIGVFAQSRR